MPLFIFKVQTRGLSIVHQILQINFEGGAKIFYSILILFVERMITLFTIKIVSIAFTELCWTDEQRYEADQQNNPNLSNQKIYR